MISRFQVVPVLVCLIGFFGCSNHELPFDKVNYGVDSYLGFINERLENGSFKNVANRDNWYQYYVALDDTSVKVYVEVNPDGYHFGKVREIMMHLGGDTLFGESQFFSPGTGYRKARDLELLLQEFQRSLGEPTLKEDPNALDISLLLHRTKPEDAPPDIYRKWQFEDYDVTLNYSSPNVDISEKTGNNEYYNSWSSIIFSMKNYESRFQEMKDSVLAHLGPGDLIKMDVSKPEWIIYGPSHDSVYDTRMEVQYSRVMRVDIEEPRAVTEIRFDAVVSDSFGKELCRLRDITFQPSEPLHGLVGGVTTYRNEPMTVTLEYSRIYSDDADEYERARLYSMDNPIKVATEITGVVFEDGDVLLDD